MQYYLQYPGHGGYLDVYFRWMDKEDVVHIQKGLSLGHKKSETKLLIGMWMNLELVIWCKVSQKEKHKYHILMHIYAI